MEEYLTESLEEFAKKLLQNSMQEFLLEFLDVVLPLAVKKCLLKGNLPNLFYRSDLSDSSKGQKKLSHLLAEKRFRRVTIIFKMF